MSSKFPALARGLVLMLLSAISPPENPGSTAERGPHLLVLGVAQDGGYPQAGCERTCCRRAWKDPRRWRHVASLAIVDPEASQRWLLDATPDLREQLRALGSIAPARESPPLTGILLTHGHIGHYAGLIQLGREVMGAREIPVYAMPRMTRFLSSSGPWDQLVRLRNIVLRPMEADVVVPLNPRITVIPFRVPHRDEYSETVGFRIEGPRRTALYLPDIDKWEKWTTPVEKVLADVDVAYLDGTFYDESELPRRDPAEIPHPFIVETMKRLASLPTPERAKVRFIHLNHSNPVLDPRSPAARALRKSGFRAAVEGERFGL